MTRRDLAGCRDVMGMQPLACAHAAERDADGDRDRHRDADNETGSTEAHTAQSTPQRVYEGQTLKMRLPCTSLELPAGDENTYLVEETLACCQLLSSCHLEGHVRQCADACPPLSALASSVSLVCVRKGCGRLQRCCISRPTSLRAVSCTP